MDCGGEVIPPNSAALPAPQMAVATTFVALFVVAIRRLFAKNRYQHGWRLKHHYDNLFYLA